MDRGDYDGAIEDLTTAVRLLPKEDAIYARRGTARMFKQDYEGAVADLSAAIAINPNGAYAYEIRGLARQSQSDFDAAIADYTKAILLDPVDGTTFRSRARARAERLWSDKTRANNPNVSIPETLNALQEAESDYAEALRLNPKDAEATAALKDIQAELTRTKEALHPVQQNPKRAQAPTVDIPTARSIAPDRSESRPIDYPGEKYPETRTRLIGEMEAATMSSAQLRYAINEVYARHGGEFRSEPEIHDYFQKFSWYHPKKGASRDQVENEFSEIERANVDLLARYKDQKK